jgi:hypothetical protein
MKAIEERCKNVTYSVPSDDIINSMCKCNNNDYISSSRRYSDYTFHKPIIHDEISLSNDNIIELQYRRLLTRNYPGCTFEKSIDITKELKDKLEKSTFEEIVRSYVLIYGDDTSEIETILDGGNMILNEEYKDFDELYIDIIVDAAIDMIKPVIRSSDEETLTKLLFDTSNQSQLTNSAEIAEDMLYKLCKAITYKDQEKEESMGYRVSTFASKSWFI